jgi:hypothetical protein
MGLFVLVVIVILWRCALVSCEGVWRMDIYFFCEVLKYCLKLMKVRA